MTLFYHYILIICSIPMSASLVTKFVNAGFNNVSNSIVKVIVIEAKYYRTFYHSLIL